MESLFAVTLSVDGQGNTAITVFFCVTSSLWTTRFSYLLPNLPGFKSILGLLYLRWLNYCAVAGPRMMASEDSCDSIDQPTNNIIPSFSFSGCGFLGVYHVGVALCLRDHTDVCHREEILWGGASAGSLVATALLSGLDFGEFNVSLSSSAS